MIEISPSSCQATLKNRLIIFPQANDFQTRAVPALFVS